MVFCTKCGTQISEGAAFCGNCGSAVLNGGAPAAPAYQAGTGVIPRVKGFDEKYCSSCGEPIKIAAEVCLKCGVRQRSASSSRFDDGYMKSPKDWATLLILSIFLGTLGVDRFYVGKVGTGILKLLVTIVTFGIGGFIWWVIDIILIVGGNFTDSDGKVVKK